MYSLARIIFTVYCYIFNRFKVHGRENQIPDGAVILYCNHFSMFDIFALNVAIKRKITFMAKQSLFETPVIRFFVKKYGAFPVDREHVNISSIRNSFQALKNGNVLGIFPEGTRVRKGKTAQVKPGFAAIAIKSGVPLQPVRLEYKRNLMLFNKIDVYIGKSISVDDVITEESERKNTDLISKRLMDICYGLGK